MEKRECERTAAELPVSFSGAGLAGGGLVSELSSRGCKMVSDELMLPGMTVALHIQLPDQYAPLKVDLAEIRWAQGEDCGMEFQRMRLEEKELAEQFPEYRPYAAVTPRLVPRLVPRRSNARLFGEHT